MTCNYNFAYFRLDKANDEMIQIKTGRQTQELVIERLSAAGEAIRTRNKGIAAVDDLHDQ